MSKIKEEHIEKHREIYEFPELIAYQFDKQCNHIYFCYYDKWAEQEFTIILDAYEFLQWFSKREIEEIKKNLIKTIEKI